MPDCSDLKDAYDKAKERGEERRREADRDKHDFEESESDFNFEEGRNCELHNVSVILPDGTPASGPDTEGQAACLKERDRAMDHARDKMERDRNRKDTSENDAENAEGAAETAQIYWCACEEKNRHDDEEPEFDFEDFPASEPGDWNEGGYDNYVIA
jgi:hypothetical protein